MIQRLFAFMMLLLLPMFAMANTQYKEGVNYDVIEGLPPMKSPQVTELFSIYCGGCFQWDMGPINDLKTWLKAENITFEQVPMTFMGNYAKQASLALAMTKGTPRYGDVKAALFKHIHVLRKGDWKNDQQFFETLALGGLTEKEFNSMKNSMPVMKTTLDWNRYANKIMAVPSFLINNRYLIKMNSIKSYDEMHELISYLKTLPTA